MPNRLKLLELQTSQKLETAIDVALVNKQLNFQIESQKNRFRLAPFPGFISIDNHN